MVSAEAEAAFALHDKVKQIDCNHTALYQRSRQGGAGNAAAQNNHKQVIHADISDDREQHNHRSLAGKAVRLHQNFEGVGEQERRNERDDPGDIIHHQCLCLRVGGTEKQSDLRTERKEHGNHSGGEQQLHHDGLREDGACPFPIPGTEVYCSERGTSCCKQEGDGEEHLHQRESKVDRRQRGVRDTSCHECRIYHGIEGIDKLRDHRGDSKMHKLPVQR